VTIPAHFQGGIGNTDDKEIPMGFRRRRRRRAIVAGAAIASSRNNANQQQDYEQAPADDQTESAAPAGQAEEIEHLAQLHASGALTDEEFAEAKANVIAG
jgi:hypothetical protein